jgi:hypothetical protein
MQPKTAPVFQENRKFPWLLRGVVSGHTEAHVSRKLFWDNNAERKT